MFDGIADVSGAIKIEGQKISPVWMPTVPTQNQGTIEWNIPTPLAGCNNASSINSAYCGVVVLLHTSPVGPDNIPEDGVQYEADPTANPSLHVGDRIGGALVVGAFYEPNEKARGEELTTSVIINDIGEGPHYLAVYAVDCSLQYHSDGVRTYSDSYGDDAQPNTPSIAAVVLNDGDGAAPTDGTGLEIGKEYSFDFDLNTNFPNDSFEGNRVSVSIDGEDGQTYEDMIGAINEQLALVDNPPRSSEPPNSGSYYWNPNNKVLQVYDGTNYSGVDDVILSDTDPTDVTNKPYWVDLSGGVPILKIWNGTNFDEINTIIHTSDPSNPSCDELWFDGLKSYSWSGNAWCDVQSFIQDNDPSLPTQGICGEYWFKEDTSELFKYNVSDSVWEPTSALTWKVAPDALGTDTYWFNPDDRMMRERVVYENANTTIGNWNLLPPITGFVIGEVTPIIYPNLIWYKESEDTFYKYNGDEFIEIDVIEWNEDPTLVTSCELWWDDVSDRLFERSSIRNSWVEVVKLTQDSQDPLRASDIDNVSTWLDTSTTPSVYKTWNGSFYEEAENYIDFPSDPTIIADGDAAPAWYNPESGLIQLPKWNDLPSEPTFSVDDPSQPPTGKLWFNESTNELMVRSGINWLSQPYTTAPIVNNVGTLWFDLVNDQLNEWDGKKYVPATPKVQANMDERGNLLFQTRETGTCISLLMLVPGQDYNPSVYDGTAVTRVGSPLHAHVAGFKQVYTDNPFRVPRYINSNVTEENFLFNALEGAQVQATIAGTDGLESVPSYDQLGVGTDGTPDERRELAHSIRVQLGWPVVEVELTDEQLDTAIQGAFESLRKRSDIAYDRRFFTMDVRAGVQQYQLTNKKAGFNTIVGIMGAHRRSGAFSGGFSSNSIFDQLFAQQLYGTSTAGGFDMTTLHLSQQYIEQLELMFATRINYHFIENDRTIYFHQNFHRHERILLDAYCERTEQDLLKDRLVKSWIERFALGGARMTLSEIRGKFASLPGSGGGVSLNAAELASQAATDFAECYSQLDNFTASRPEMYGAHDFVIG